MTGAGAADRTLKSGDIKLKLKLPLASKEKCYIIVELERSTRLNVCQAPVCTA
jgi:hypothetical protein